MVSSPRISSSSSLGLKSVGTPRISIGPAGYPLNLRDNNIGAEGAGMLAAVLGQCASLAHLHLQGNGIGDEGAGRLAAVLGQCASLAHLNLGGARRGWATETGHPRRQHGCRHRVLSLRLSLSLTACVCGVVVGRARRTDTPKRYKKGGL